MRKISAVAALHALAAAASSVAAQQDPAALVVRVDGYVSVTRGAAAPSALAVGEQLFVDDVVLPGPSARAILITRSGGQQVVSERITISEPPIADHPDLFARAVTTLAQAAATDATMGGRQGMIRPIPGTSALVAPRNALAVSSPRPTFVWTSTPGKTYDLMLRRLEGGRPSIFEAGSDTTWTMPDDVDELEPGETYVWTVFVGGRRGGRPLPQQQFRTLSLVESLEMQDYLDEIAVFGLDPMAEGLFLTVVAYRDLELLYDARAALERVESQASLSRDLYMLKGEILAGLGHEEEARAAFDRADALMR